MKKYILHSSCSEFGCLQKNLDQPPQDQISDPQYWKTAQDLETYTFQFYNVFPHFRNQGSIVPNFFIGNIGNDAVYGSDRR
jgi:hypothetical protein